MTQDFTEDSEQRMARWEQAQSGNLQVNGSNTIPI